ncbi:MAG TPA: amino acid adenylation domain-containing protein [Thermoanaerobaculia bacterium]|jgi:amino acid adenylation domain-containing protein|nr:amino acid adenylation domain-containing protein [Thermoanaerobaculia bacterium]
MSGPGVLPDRLAGLSREQRAELVEELRKRRAREGAAAAPESIPRRPPGLDPGDPVPASFAQERLWFLDCLEPGNPAFNIPTALHLAGEISPVLLEAVLGEVVRRHETLRTTFRESGGQPVQVIAPPGRWVLPQIDLAGLPATARRAELRVLADREAAHAFDLERGPLLRATLLRLGAAEHALLLVMHHIISDGWSMGVLIREIAALAAAVLASGRAALPSALSAALPELPIQYADFAVWQRGWLTGSELERQLSYWRSQLAGVPKSLDLPADRPRPAVPASHGARAGSILGPELTRELSRLARRLDSTLFMVILTAFQALLWRLSGQADLPVGSPIANRNRAEIEPLIGFFVNTLVLRGDLTGDPSFAAALARVRRTTLDAYAHQDLPFERLVVELSPERHLAASPLFQVLCALQNLPGGSIELPGLSLASLDLEAAAAQFDLDLNAAESEGRLHTVLTYSTALFDATTIRRWARSLESLLGAAVDDDERPLGALPLLGEGERHQLLEEWNDTFRTAAPQSVVERFAAQVARTPDLPALEMGTERLTYAELDRRSSHLADRLRRRGIGAETTVGLFADRSPELVIGLLAIWKAGGACLPLDPGHPPARLAYMLHDSQVEWLALPGRLADRAPESMPEPRRIVIDGPHLPASPEEDGKADGTPCLSDLAYQIYTSGTTGRPKAVLVEHGNLASTLAAVQETFGFAPGDRMPCIASSSFDIFLFELLGPLLAGGTVVLLPLRPTLDLEQLLAELGTATLLHAVPAVMRQVVELARRRRLSAPRLRALLTGGDAVPADLLADLRAVFPQARSWVLYGPTEAAIVCTAWPVPPGGPPRSLLGRPLPGAEIHLCATGEIPAHRLPVPVPVGVPGEIWIGGAGVARGYWRREELTAEKLVTLGGRRFFRSGDLGRRLADGSLEFLGRADQQVKVRGFRIEPGEIEACLLRHPAVEEAVVAVRAAFGGEKQLAAYVVPKEGRAAPVIPELRRFLQAELPDYMVPAAIVPLDSLPLTAHGKVDRAALPEPELLRGERREPGSAVPPRTPAEATMAELWREVLGLDASAAVGVEESFFDLGGHSLLATQLMSRVRDAFRIEVPLRIIFETPTVAGLALWIEHARQTGAAPLRVPPLRPAPRGRDLPLSFAQERLWFLAQLAPASAAYNMPSAMRLTGRLDRAALAAALSEIVRRHEALRTVFHMTAAGGPFQVIQAHQPPPVPLIDLAALPPGMRDAESRRLAGREVMTPFDLARGPLVRAALYRLDERAAEHALLWTTHHIASDGWSVGAVFVPELAALYAAFAQGLPSPLPELPIQYADFAVWQRDWLRDEVLAAQIAYWRRQLAGAATLELPADRPRRPVPSAQGASHWLRLPAVTSERLRAIAHAESATPFMALHTAFAALLSLDTGQTDVVVGLPVANRSRKEIEGLIGFFVNTLVLRTDLSGDPDYRTALARSREVSLGAFAHQDLPFERLVDELGLTRNPFRPPLLRALFQLLNLPSGSREPSGLTLAPFELASETSKFDLVVNLTEGPDGLTTMFEYDTDLFDAATIVRLGDRFGRMLEAWIDDPARRLADLPLLSAAERQQLLIEWNAEIQDARPRRCLHRRFEEQVDRAPDAPAVSMGAERLTYRELDERANRLAHHLLARGVRPGDRIALRLERSTGLVAAILAVLKTGAAYVPLDPAYPAERLAFALEDSGATLEITAEDFENATIADRSPERPAVPADPGLPAYVIYTSGSTGRPKGVVVTHANVDRLFTATAPWFGFGADDVWTLFHSYAFDFSVWELWGPLLHGGRLAVVPFWESRSPEGFYRLLCDEKVTVLNQTPSAFRQLLWAEEAAASRGDLSLRWVIFGGEALEPAGLAPWFARHGDERPRLINMYGITETTVHVTFRPLRADDSGRGSLIGRPIPDLSLHVLDAHLQPRPFLVAGEIHVGGAGLAQGYLGRPDLTAERFVPDPFTGEPGARLYRSGDLARRLPDGDLEYLGRIDLQVKIRGFRIELGEIEAALAAHPAVREAVVLARETTGGERRLVAYAVRVPGDAVEAATLRASLAKRLPDYMLPSAFVLLDELPLTPNGKVDRKALPSPEDAGAAPLSRHVPPRTPLERFLAECFRDVLGLPADREIGVHDDFFALGGTSISGAIFIHRLQAALATAVPVVAIFNHPTVAALAEHLRQDSDRDSPGVDSIALSREILVPLQEGDPHRRPLFCVHPIGGEAVSYRDLARHLDPGQPVYGIQSPDPPLTDLREMAACYLDAIRRHQPQGPYRLAGWSMGGVAAYEMARQLAEQGETVEVLALIDTLAPALLVGEADPDGVGMIALFAAGLAWAHGLDVPAVDFTGLDEDGALTLVMSLGREAGLLPPSIELAELRRLFDRFRANHYALYTYKPDPYPGDLLLFRASIQMGEEEEEGTRGWGELVTGELRIYDLPGNHYTLLREEVGALAERLQAVL